MKSRASAERGVSVRVLIAGGVLIAFAGAAREAAACEARARRAHGREAGAADCRAWFDEALK